MRNFGITMMQGVELGRCEHCGNPIKSLHDTQCMWLEGTPPCEADEENVRKVRLVRGMVYGAVASVLCWVSVFLIWRFS
jgi:hypothetical protein